MQISPKAKALIQVEKFNSFVKEYNPEPSERHTILLKQLRNCQMKEDFPKVAGMSAIDLGTPELDPSPFLLPSTLFVREFYPRLLSAIRKSKISMIVGNSGKSVACTN